MARPGMIADVPLTRLANPSTDQRAASVELARPSEGHGFDTLLLKLGFVAKSTATGRPRSVLVIQGYCISKTRLIERASCNVSLFHDLEPNTVLTNQGQLLLNHAAYHENIVVEPWKQYASRSSPASDRSSRERLVPS